MAGPLAPIVPQALTLRLRKQASAQQRLLVLVTFTRTAVLMSPL